MGPALLLWLSRRAELLHEPLLNERMRPCQRFRDCDRRRHQDIVADFRINFALYMSTTFYWKALSPHAARAAEDDSNLSVSRFAAALVCSSGLDFCGVYEMDLPASGAHRSGAG
jgi:hypothetical protein